jgi:hypothetical protein
MLLTQTCAWCLPESRIRRAPPAACAIITFSAFALRGRAGGRARGRREARPWHLAYDREVGGRTDGTRGLPNSFLPPWSYGWHLSQNQQRATLGCRGLGGIGLASGCVAAWCCEAFGCSRVRGCVRRGCGWFGFWFGVGSVGLGGHRFGDGGAVSGSSSGSEHANGDQRSG